MSAGSVYDELERIATAPDFAAQSERLTAAWIALEISLGSVGDILRFMETHPEILYGTPGPLVHFTERFYGNGYEEMLLASLRRRPTPHTVWMLNRLINGTERSETRSAYITRLSEAKHHPETDLATLSSIDDFLARFTTLG